MREDADYAIARKGADLTDRAVGRLRIVFAAGGATENVVDFVTAGSRQWNDPRWRLG
jgi:hypothetical protein